MELEESIYKTHDIHTHSAIETGRSWMTGSVCWPVKGIHNGMNRKHRGKNPKKVGALTR
jgi:hypothetical protein